MMSFNKLAELSLVVFGLLCLTRLSYGAGCDMCADYYEVIKSTVFLTIVNKKKIFYCLRLVTCVRKLLQTKQLLSKELKLMISAYQTNTRCLFFTVTVHGLIIL